MHSLDVLFEPIINDRLITIQQVMKTQFWVIHTQPQWRVRNVGLWLNIRHEECSYKALSDSYNNPIRSFRQTPRNTTINSCRLWPVVILHPDHIEPQISSFSKHQVIHIEYIFFFSSFQVYWGIKYYEPSQNQTLSAVCLQFFFHWKTYSDLQTFQHVIFVFFFSFF